MSKWCKTAQAVTNCTDNCEQCLEEEEKEITNEEFIIKIRNIIVANTGCDMKTATATMTDLLNVMYEWMQPKFDRLESKIDLINKRRN